MGFDQRVLVRAFPAASTLCRGCTPTPQKRKPTYHWWSSVSRGCPCLGLAIVPERFTERHKPGIHALHITLLMALSSSSQRLPGFQSQEEGDSGCIGNRRGAPPSCSSSGTGVGGPVPWSLGLAASSLHLPVYSCSMAPPWPPDSEG